MREAIVHEQNITISFGCSPDGIYFEIVEGVKRLKDILIKWNVGQYVMGEGESANLINFKLYAAFFMVKLQIFLDKLTEICKKYFEINKLESHKKVGPDIQDYLGRYEIIQKWYQKLLNRVKSLNS